MTRTLIAFLFLLAAATPALAQDVDLKAIAADIHAQGDRLIAAYDPAQGRVTGDAVSDLYFDVFEASGMEQAIGMKSATAKTELEAMLGEIIGLAGQGKDKAVVAAKWQGFKDRLDQTVADMSVKSGDGGFLSVFLQSLLILVREGFEAMLVVTALVAWLRRSEQQAKVKVVWQGVGAAVVLSLVAAWVLDRVLKVSGADQEVLEGIILLFAALVLFYVSFWLLSKREAATWQAYVREQVEQAAKGDRVWALGLAAFLAVFREGAETVLFYQALALSSPGQTPALIAGIAAALVLLTLLYAAMRFLSFRLPMGLFFSGTAALLFALSVSFAGKGVLELQEGRWLPITPLDGLPRVEWLGLFPTAEGLAAQMVLLLPMLAALAWSWHRKKKRLA
jgi:high-affinity iron transporter